MYKNDTSLAITYMRCKMKKKTQKSFSWTATVINIGGKHNEALLFWDASNMELKQLLGHGKAIKIKKNRFFIQNS